MKFKFPIANAYLLQHVLNCGGLQAYCNLSRLRRAVPNKGVKSFERKWANWSEEEKRQFLSDVVEIRGMFRELGRSKVEVEGTIE